MISVNAFNELLYDWIIPRLFEMLYDLKEFEHHEPEEIELVKEPEEGYYTVERSRTWWLKRPIRNGAITNTKVFILIPMLLTPSLNVTLFWSLLTEGKVKKVYFTGMLTHGQSDFYIQYIDPESHAVRRYYPDFLMQKDDDSWVIVEVKGDNKIDDDIVCTSKG